MRMAALKLTSPPAAEPVALAEMKLYLKVESAIIDDDALITALITSARRQAEEHTGRALVTQTWSMLLDGPGGLSAEEEDAWEELTRSTFIPERYRAIVLPRPPLQSVTSVKYYDEDDAEHTWASTNYRLDTYSEPGRILLASGGSWPSGLRAQQGFLVEFVAGYGDASAVPEDIKTAILMMVAHWYENREAQEMPAGAKRLLASHRVVSL